MTRNNYGLDANDIFNQMVNKALSRSDQDLQMLGGVDQNSKNAYFALQNQLGQSLPINSAQRSPEYNASVGGVSNSQHIPGNALDFDISRLSPEQRANLPATMRQSGFTGIGQYPGRNFAHGDTRTQAASWVGTPEGSRSNVPTNLMAAQEPNSLLTEQQAVAPQGATLMGQESAPQGLDYDTIVQQLTANQPSSTRQAWADALGVLSKGLGDMGSGRAVDVSGVLQSQMKQRAVRQAALAKSKTAAGMAVTMSKMPNGEKYAKMLASGVAIPQVMKMYEFEQGQLFTRENMDLRNEWSIKAAETEREFTTEERVAGQTFTVGERKAGELFKSSERVGGEGFTTGERVAGQEFKTGERVGGEEARSAIADADRTSRELGYLNTARTATQNRDSREDQAALDRANTVELSEYDKYISQGGGDTFTTWDRKNKQASVQPLEDWERRARLENVIKLDNSFIAKKEDDYAGQTALWRKISAMEPLLSDPDFSSGTVTAVMAPLLLGVADVLPGLFSDDFRKKLVAGEKFETGVMSIYTTLTQALKGAISDLEGGKAAMGNLQYSKDEATNKYLFSLQKNAYKRNGAEIRFIRNAVSSPDADGKYMNSPAAQHEWDKKVARGDVETVPLAYNTDKMSKANFIANIEAGNLGIGDYVVRTVDGKLVPTRIDDQEDLNNLMLIISGG